MTMLLNQVLFIEGIDDCAPVVLRNAATCHSSL